MDHSLNEISTLLTLVTQSYEALNIGQINNISELKFVIEHVEAVKKQALEIKHPDDVESLGLAALFFNNEETDTFERAVSFFHKKKPGSDIPWSSFTVKNGRILINNEMLEDSKNKD